MPDESAELRFHGVVNLPRHAGDEVCGVDEKECQITRREKIVRYVAVSGGSFSTYWYVEDRQGRMATLNNALSHESLVLPRHCILLVYTRGVTVDTAEMSATKSSYRVVQSQSVIFG